MYENFYNLKEKPFDLTPSPRFFYLGESHKEALALLNYGVVERKGIILLTGEVGTGKTTTVRTLLANLDKSVKYVHISNPLLSPKEFMEYLAVSAFKKKIRFKSKVDFLVEFEAFLKDCLYHQTAFILIIDEAQTLSFELMEEIRLLSNMEIAYEKLINICLVGQPELNEKLNDIRCKALLQRINNRYHIPPLNLEDTREYMKTRLKVAGARDLNEIFSKGAVKVINKYSQGYPRVINILADNCLLLGYSKGKRKITSSIVQKSHEDMKLDISIPKVTQEILRPNEKGKKSFGTKKNTSLYWKRALPDLKNTFRGSIVSLTKEGLIESIYNKAGYSKKKSIEMFESMLEILKSTLESGEDVLISGFGKFCVKEKRARRGRNPATGNDLMLGARKVVIFKCSKVLRNKINTERRRSKI